MFEDDWEGASEVWEKAKVTLKELQASHTADLNLLWGDFHYVVRLAEVLEAYALVTGEPLSPLQATLVKACNYQHVINTKLCPFDEPISNFPPDVNLDAIREVVWETPKVDALCEDKALFMVFAMGLHDQLTQADHDTQRFAFARCPDCDALFIPAAEGQIYDSPICENWAKERAQLTEALQLLTEKQNSRREKQALAGTWEREAGKIS